MLARLALLAVLIAPPGDGSPSVREPRAGAPSVGFAAPRVIVPPGEQRAIALRLPAPAPEDATLTLQSSDAGVLEVTRQPRVLAGQTLAFARVRALKAGACELRLGDAVMTIEAPPGRTPPAPTPQITGPADGAVVWDTVAVSVALTDPASALGSFPGEISLRLSDGRTLQPEKQSSPARGPTRRALFVLDLQDVRSARLELEPVWRLLDGTERAGQPVDLRVVHPSEADVIAGEAEDITDVKRPERFARPIRRGAIGSDPEASAGKYLNNSGSEPALCFPVTVETPGLYQVILRARGTFAGGALPTVGLVIDGAQYAATNGRVPDEAWRRFSVGVPVALGAGEHVLTPFFENDFYVPNLADRNLFLDRIEVVRVPDDARAAPAGDTAMMPGMKAQEPPKAAAPGEPKGEMAMTMMGARAGPAVARETPDPWGISGRPVRVAFVRPLDGRPVAGELVIDGVTTWEREGAPAPEVLLLLNSKAYAVQRSAVPRFVVDPADLAPGDNTLQLVATNQSGSRDRTPLQHVRWSPPPDQTAPSTPHSQRRYLRYTIHDTGWDETATKSLSREHGPPERRAISFFSGAEATFTLPDDLAGTFEVFIDSSGQEFQGPPILAAALLRGEERTPIGETPVQGYWTPRKVGKIELTPGAKKLAIAFTNDKFEEGKGDRNVWFQAIVLHETPPEDRAAPVARISYPGAGAMLGMADAVVAEFSDDRAVSRVELLLDGHETGVNLDVAGQPGRVLLPLVTRTLPEGAHTLSVRATDTANKRAESTPVSVTIAHSPGTPTRYEHAVRLLNRLGYGPEPDELADVLTAPGELEWLRAALSQDSDDTGDLTAIGLALARFPNGRGEYDIPRRAITHAMLTRASVRARFVLWTENHFSTWVRKTEGDRKWLEHVRFAQLGAAPFLDLLRASATSPAMLRYLDQEQSYAAKLNENYAREIMELHTLGVHGGYTQQDVTSLAHLLTGWTTAREGDGMSGGEMRGWSFTFDPALSEGKPTRVVGVEFPEASPGERYDRVRFALEVLAAHPSTAQFVCRKLAEHYVSVPAPDALVADLAARFTETGGDMTEVMLALATHPEFTRADLPDRLAHPMDYALRLARTTRNHNPWGVGDFLQRSGNGLFDRSTPDGYPEEDSAYVDSNALLQRWRLAQESQWGLAGLVPDPLRYGDVPKDSTEAEQWMQAVVDLIAVRLTGRVLGAASNDAALDVLRALKANKQDRILQVGPFIAQLPEASLR